MITEIDDWTLYFCRTSEEVNNKMNKLCSICDNNDGQLIHIYLTHSTGLSDDLHNIMEYFRNRRDNEYEYSITTTVKNDRPRVLLNIRWKVDEGEE